MSVPSLPQGVSHEPAQASPIETVDEPVVKDTRAENHSPQSEPAFQVDSAAAELAEPVRTTDFTPGALNAPGLAGLEAPDAPTTDHPGKAVTAVRKGKRIIEVPASVAGYEVLGVLGRGGMGVVYKARQPGLNRLVALKMILAGEHADQRDLRRFRIEAEAVAQLQHANIVQIYEVGEDAGRPYFSLEFIDGTSLAQKINGTPLPARQAAELLLQLAHALDYAHQKGIIHRDIKPANILLTTDGIPKITDFGLAKRVEDESGQTHSGTVLGTPSYMPPEQAEGRLHEIGPRSDVYSLGAVLYDMLTGRPPFRGTTMLDTLKMVQNQEPVAPAEFQPQMPRDLQTICLTCLHKDVARRYASAGALAEDVRRFLAGEPILARPAGAGERLWRWCRRNPRVAGLSAALALLLVIWAGTFSVLYPVAKRNERAAQENEQRAIGETARADAKAKEAERNAEAARVKQQQAFRKMVTLGDDLQKRLRSRRLSEQLGPQAQQMQQQLMDVLRKQMLEMTGELEKSEGIHSYSNVALHQQLGDLLLRLGQGKQALSQYEEGRRLIEREVQEQPNSDLARANLGVMLMRLGDIALEVNGDAKAARDYYQKGWDLQNEIVLHPRGNDFPDQQKTILLSHHAVHLGRAYLAMGRPVEAAKHFEQALKLRQEWAAANSQNAESRGYLVEVHMWLGTAAWHRADAKAFDQSFGEALQRMEQLLKEVPYQVSPKAHISLKSDAAEVYAAQGDGLARLGRHDEARTSYMRSWENLQTVMSHDPDDPSSLPLMAPLHERLGADAQRRGQQADAQKHYQEALKIYQEFVQLEPDNRVRQAAYLLALARGGKQAEAARGAETLQPVAVNSAELLVQLARCHAVCAAAAQKKQDALAKARQALQALAALDYRDPVLLRTDADLASLRTEPAFLALLGKRE